MKAVDGALAQWWETNWSVILYGAIAGSIHTNVCEFIKYYILGLDIDKGSAIHKKKKQMIKTNNYFVTKDTYKSRRS